MENVKKKITTRNYEKLQRMIYTKTVKSINGYKSFLRIIFSDDSSLSVCAEEQGCLVYELSL